MTTAWVDMYDATGANYGHLPAGQHAGYMTGLPPVPWSAAQIADSPDVVLIDQSPVNTYADETADVYDYEFRAGTLSGIPGWCAAAQYYFEAHQRPGQRKPCVYASQDSQQDVINTLIAHGIIRGVNRAIANYGLSRDEAIAIISGPQGSFPVVWVQYEDAGLYDKGIVSVPWLKEVSTIANPDAPTAPVPPGQWLDPDAWTWATAVTGGIGLDGKLHMFELQGGTWVKVIG